MQSLSKTNMSAGSSKGFGLDKSDADGQMPLLTNFN